MPTYKIPVTWLMGGTLHIEANSLEEAEEQAMDGELPFDLGYIDDSFRIDYGDPEYGELVDESENVTE